MIMSRRSAGANVCMRARIRRARLFAAIVCALLLGAGDARAEESSAQARHINPQRLQATLEKLSEFGRNPEGGVTRLGFSQTDLDARAYVISLMKDAGLEIRVDPAGNIFGRRPGSEQLPTLLFGSHINSVPHGGNFDGPLGSLGAIEVIRALNDGAHHHAPPARGRDLDKRGRSALRHQRVRLRRCGRSIGTGDPRPQG